MSDGLIAAVGGSLLAGIAFVMSGIQILKTETVMSSELGYALIFLGIGLIIVTPIIFLLSVRSQIR